MTLHPTKHTSKGAGVHTIQDGWLKHSTNKSMTTYTWLQEARRYQPAPRPKTMPHESLPGWQSAWTTGSLARMDRSIAESQLVTTLSQQLAMSHKGLQSRLQLNHRQRVTIDPELPEDLKGCAPFAASAHFRWGGFLQNPKPASQESQVSIAGHAQIA